MDMQGCGLYSAWRKRKGCSICQLFSTTHCDSQKQKLSKKYYLSGKRGVTYSRQSCVLSSAQLNFYASGVRNLVHIKLTELENSNLIAKIISCQNIAGNQRKSIGSNYFQNVNLFLISSHREIIIQFTLY
jgi:hypothetical protein